MARGDPEFSHVRSVVLASVLISPRRSTSSVGSTSPSTSWKVKALAWACNRSASAAPGRGLRVRKRSRISPFSTLRCTASRVCGGCSHSDAANAISSSAARRAAAASGAPNFSINWLASRSIIASRSASVASVTMARVDQPRLSIPRNPERSATRCFWPSVAGSRFQNTNAPETAHSPGSAARSKTKVSDGSSLMVRGNLDMSASSEFRAARLRIIPSRTPKRIHKTAPDSRSAAGRLADQKIAVDVDAADLAGLAPGKPLQIVPRDRLEAALFPAVEGGHQVAAEAFDDRIGINHLETFAQQGYARGRLHLRHMRHGGRAQDHAENEPFGYVIFGAFGRPAQPSAAEQPRVEPDRIRPVERDLPLRRTMGCDRIGQRIHPRKECPARRAQRFVGFEHHRKLDQIVAAHPHQCPRARLRRDLTGPGEGIAEFAQRDQSITGGQIECLFRISETSDHEELFPHCFKACGCMLSRARWRRERPLYLADIRPSGYRRTAG